MRRLCLQNVGIEQWNKILEFIYIGRLTITKDKLELLQAAAKKLQIQELMDLCQVLREPKEVGRLGSEGVSKDIINCDSGSQPLQSDSPKYKVPSNTQYVEDVEEENMDTDACRVFVSRQISQVADSKTNSATQKLTVHDSDSLVVTCLNPRASTSAKQNVSGKKFCNCKPRDCKKKKAK